MVSREKCLSMIKESGFNSPDNYKLTVSHAAIFTLEALINMAYNEGQMDMLKKCVDIVAPTDFHRARPQDYIAGVEGIQLLDDVVKDMREMGV